jgi:uncharacterized protein YjbJ (UPF0337 family)
MSEKIFTKSPDMWKWNEHKDRLKQKFSDLTDQDLEFEPGRMDKMFEKLKVKLGKSKEDMHKFIAYLSQIF